jgi:hypothetical protein
MCLGLWALAVAAVAGCAPRAIRPMGEPHHVVVLPGVLGHSPGFDRIPRIIDEELEDASVQIWNWKRIDALAALNPIRSLRDHTRNRARAKVLANHLTQCRRANPHLRTSLVALSGGAGVALFACEELPPDVMLDRVVLLSPAVSPGYDLTAAMAHTKSGIVNYYSRGDWFVLKRGTTTFGTADRVYGPAAGYQGFDHKAACPGCGDRLTQIEWHDGLRKLGASGGHASAQEKKFIRHCVVEWLRGNLTACDAP